MHLIRPSHLSSYWNYLPFSMCHLILLPKNLPNTGSITVGWFFFTFHISELSQDSTAKNSCGRAEIQSLIPLPTAVQHINKKGDLSYLWLMRVTIGPHHHFHIKQQFHQQKAPTVINRK